MKNAAWWGDDIWESLIYFIYFNYTTQFIGLHFEKMEMQTIMTPRKRQQLNSKTQTV